MTLPLYLPIDVVTGSPIDYDQAADFLELSAFFSDDSRVLTSDLANEVSIGAAEDHSDLEDEMQNGEEELVSSTVNRIESRQFALSSSYPFRLDSGGDSLEYILNEDSIGQAAYILSLVLSNLRSMSPVLDGSELHPNDEEVKRLRVFFQYFATAALAAEIQGEAWSFGFPRPDRSPFLGKLKEIWQKLRDGQVMAQPGAPTQAKDDKVDVFAARPHKDGLPGFLLAAAQVATGQNAKDKTLKGHLSAFKSRWFAQQPVTKFLIYMIVPFAKADDQFLDYVRVMGNVLHRLRVPRCVAEAEGLVKSGVEIEGYEKLADALQWIVNYRDRARNTS